MEQYYVCGDAGESGPFPAEEIRRMLKSGKLEASAVGRKASERTIVVLSTAVSASPPPPQASGYTKPILASVIGAIAVLGLIFGIIAALLTPNGTLVGIIATVFSALLLFGIAQLIDLIGRIEFNTRP
jgi:predicted phage tail protein